MKHRLNAELLINLRTGLSIAAIRAMTVYEFDHILTELMKTHG